jgi:hypothetical protein
MKLEKREYAVINQPRGLGDIIWMEPIARKLYEDGYKVKWIVDPQFLILQKHTNYIEFVNIKSIDYREYDRREITYTGDSVILPMRWADSILKVPYSKCMKSKYMFFDMDWECGRHPNWLRDEYSELRLFKQILTPKPYNLIHEESSMGKSSIPVKGVKLFANPNYSIFDWYYVVINAAEIHMVASGPSIAVDVMLQRVKDNKPKLFLYKRPNDNHNNHDYCYSCEWSFL